MRTIVHLTDTEVTAFNSKYPLMAQVPPWAVKHKEFFDAFFATEVEAKVFVQQMNREDACYEKLQTMLDTLIKQLYTKYNIKRDRIERWIRERYL